MLHGVHGLALYFACSVAFGILFSKVIEIPVLHLRDRIFPPEVVTEIPAGVPRSSLHQLRDADGTDSEIAAASTK